MKEYDIISPEGVDERVKDEFTARVTLTQGGKYRTYGVIGDEVQSKGVFDTLEEAQKSMAAGLILFGSFMRDPEGTVKAALAALVEDEDKGEKSK